MHAPRDVGEPSAHERPIRRMAVFVIVILVLEIVVLGLLTRGCA